MREYQVNCPFCAQRGKTIDRKRHLYVNPSKNAAICFRCGFKSRHAAEALASQGITSPVADLADLEALADRPDIKLPSEILYDWTENAFGRHVWSYLRHRHLSRTTIGAYGIGYCCTGRYRGRVVIPIYQDGVLATFQARDLTNKSRMRYLGPAGGRTKDVLFNIERATASGVVILVEGPFDALRIPEHGVALLGKEWNAAKRDRLLMSDVHTVFIRLDNETATQEVQNRIESDLTGCIPQVLRLPAWGKDLGEASDAEMVAVRRLVEASRAAASGDAAGD